MSEVPRIRRSALATVATVAFVAAACSAVAATPSPYASPRIVELTPRVVTLKPRVMDIRPKRERKTYVVEADVLFAFDSAKLSPGAANVLDDVVQTLRKERARRVVVTGYTDSIGSTDYNRSLSQRRADAVRRYLEGQVSGPGYRSTGRGESHPVAANRTPDGHDNPTGRRRNRRVTVSYT